MLLYVLSFGMIVAPLGAVFLLTSRLSMRMKMLLIVLMAVVMIMVPIAAFWLFGGSAGNNL